MLETAEALVTLINKQAASGLLTREILVLTNKLQQEAAALRKEVDKFRQLGYAKESKEANP